MEEGRSRGSSLLLSASWGVCTAAVSPASLYSCFPSSQIRRAAFHNLPKSGASLPLCKSTSSLTDMRRITAEIRILGLHHTPFAHIISQLLPTESICFCPRLLSGGVTVSESQASICLAFFLNLLLEKQDFS